MTALAWQNEDSSIVYRVGYQPDPFAWTPWQYATDGRFAGRWDDRDGRFRTLYVADRILGCLLEVLADFRPDLAVLAGLNDIDSDDDDEYPTAPGGTVPVSWLHPRTAGQALMSGEFALGLPELDAAALKLRAPRRLTQQIAGWLYQQQPPPGGVRFGSRHDDRFRMWALFEQPGEDKTGSRRLTDQLPIALTVDTPELLEAFDVFGLTWN